MAKGKSAPVRGVGLLLLPIDLYVRALILCAFWYKEKDTVMNSELLGELYNQTLPSTLRAPFLHLSLADSPW